MPEPVHVHQALFGYREGHNLLAGSISLSPRTRHFLATVTDSSGTESSEGFDCAFTGVPVPETDYYALFRTWPAPEMPRPGCVWSHVLLIELTDLARLSNLSVLRDFFRRPTIPLQQGFSDYVQELMVVPSFEPILSTNSIDRPRASILLAALYEQPESSVVVLDDVCSPWENIVFHIWSQQWPRLRRNFTFSTGSLGDRRLGGVNFDLQIAPAKSQRLWRRAEATKVVIEMTTRSAHESSVPSWMEVVLADLENHENSELRKFFFDYGSDIEKPRRAFLRLVHAFINLNSSQDWGDQLRLIGSLFLNETEALRLKEFLVTPKKPFSEQSHLEQEWSTACFLLSAPEAKAYAKISFDHAGLAPLLWDRKREEVLDLVARLVRRDENPSAMAFAKAIGKCIKPDDLRNIAFRHPELISVFISQQIALAHEVGTWELPGYVQSQIFEILEGLSLNYEEWGKIMGAMFLAATYVSVRSAVRNAGPYAMQGAFRGLSNEMANRILPSSGWRESLTESAANQMDSDGLLSPSELAFCCWIVPPEIVRRKLSASRKDILELAARPLEDLPKPLRNHTAFVLVALGLRGKSLEAVKLIKRGYFQVYAILANTQATSEEWALLSPELPRIGRWSDWDRCEKLRRAVRQWLLAHRKSGNLLVEAAKTPEENEIARQIEEPDSQAEEDDDFID
jgi:hypothetical protein